MIERIYRQYIDSPTWNLTRALRVGFGAFLLVLGLVNYDGLTTILGSLLLLQGILNAGCMGGACAVPLPAKHPNDPFVPTIAEDER
ncbi:MAG: hypothetical protein AAGN35_09785 [Bacteroidota bacterium]